MSHARAFLNDFSFTICLAVIPCSTIFMIAIPACFASMILLLCTAGIVPFPGSAIPTASQRQFMLFAVYIPEHDPHPGQTFCSNSSSFSSSIMPAFLAPTASNILESEVSTPPTNPDIIGPPEQTTAGISILQAPMSIPGTILSQFGMRTRPSNWCALAIDSTLSAMSSRDGSEYFIPICPIAIPSQTPIAGTMIGVPPAILTPALTASVILSR